MRRPWWIGAWGALQLILVLGSPAWADGETPASPLQGIWRGWVVHGRGETPDRGHLHVEIVFKDGRIASHELNSANQPVDSLGEGTFNVATDGKLQTIDAVRTSNPGKGQTYLGIYEVQGDTLKWCVGTPRKPRPAEFLTQKGQFLMILKKQPAP